VPRCVRILTSKDFEEGETLPKITGIGGLFFRAREPTALAAWYEIHLGINDIAKSVWAQEAGPTVFGPFSEKTEYFGRSQQQWMVNFRVDDLEAMIAKLEAAGIAVETRAEWDSEVGRFCRIYDPEGNPVELWEPAATRNPSD
jgi:glyoxylase I family protein